MEISSIWVLDLILFSGSDLTSSVIKRVSEIHADYGEYSHCGIVVNRELLPHVREMKPGKLYVLESTMTSPVLPATDGLPNIRDEYRFGVQIRDLEETVKHYNSSQQEEGTRPAVTWIPIDNNPCRTRELTKQEKTQIRKVYSKFGTSPYDMINVGFAVLPYYLHGVYDNIAKAIRKTSCLFSDNKPLARFDDLEVVSRFVSLLDEDAQFCSEIVARFYIAIGLIDMDVDPEVVTPVEFVTGLINRPNSIHLDITRAIDLQGSI